MPSVEAWQLDKAAALLHGAAAELEGVARALRGKPEEREELQARALLIMEDTANALYQEVELCRA